MTELSPTANRPGRSLPAEPGRPGRRVECPTEIGGIVKAVNGQGKGRRKVVTGGEMDGKGRREAVK